jgi:hypothetical protein
MLEINGKAKVSELDVVFMCQKNILRLDIPVNPCSIMKVAQRPQERHNYLLHGTLARQGAVGTCTATFGKGMQCFQATGTRKTDKATPHSK